MKNRIMKTDNELIAEFMGEYYDPDRRGPNRYDNDWNKLMSVVEKIYSTADDYTISFAGLLIFELSISAPRDDVYKAVVDFVKWHNSK